jgi:hypothetical protein
MDWQHFGKLFTAWSQATEGKHSVYFVELRGEWFIYLRVSRTKGLMLAETCIEERLSASDLHACQNPEEFGCSIAAKMNAEFA